MTALIVLWGIAPRAPVEGRWTARLKKAENDSFARSQENLLEVIEKWSAARRIQDFLSSLDREVAALSPEQRVPVEERISAARASLCVPNALELLKGWKSPAEEFERIWAEQKRRIW